MKSQIKLAIIFSFVIVYFFMKFHMFVETTYLISFFSENIIFLFVSFLLINASAIGILLLEAEELLLSDTSPNVSKTTKQLMTSINTQMRLVKKQIVLILIAVAFLIYYDYVFIQNNQEYIVLFNIFIITFFVYEITILYDTVKGVFVVR